jgi:hypothetical protein
MHGTPYRIQISMLEVAVNSVTFLPLGLLGGDEHILSGKPTRLSPVGYGCSLLACYMHHQPQQLRPAPQILGGPRV